MVPHGRGGIPTAGEKCHQWTDECPKGRKTRWYNTSSFCFFFYYSLKHASESWSRIVLLIMKNELSSLSRTMFKGFFFNLRYFSKCNNCIFQPFLIFFSLDCTLSSLNELMNSLTITSDVMLFDQISVHFFNVNVNSFRFQLHECSWYCFYTHTREYGNCD